MNDAAKIKIFSFVSFACIVAVGSAVLVVGFPTVAADPAAVTAVPVSEPPLVGLAAGAVAAVRFRQYLRRKFGGRRR